MSRVAARHRQAKPRRRAALVVAASVVAVALVMSLGTLLVYRHLEGNITALDTSDVLGSDRPQAFTPAHVDHKPLNILLIGSDTRDGQGNHIGGETPGLSDTTILLHLSADRQHAYGVSIPRDSMVERPSCVRKDGGGTDPGGLSMFNAAYAIGGPGCTQRTVEQLTGIRIDHFVVVDFNGFKNMVNALDGVPVCVPSEVNDTIGNIHLPAGSYEVSGQQALSYVRLRHGLSENGDIGRMKRQQAFLASMANKAISAGTLTNPVRLYNFLDAATKSLTTDPELANLKELAGLAHQLQNIGLDQIQFLTVPWETYEPDPNRLVWAPEADRLWRALRLDKPLPKAARQHVTTAAEQGKAKPEGGSKAQKSGDAAAPAQPDAGSETSTQAAEARENGLCA
ncbi:MAG TPA: LCP family protein [Nocardioidaceae bacterium]|nr:LCP family protein [Nocardioidaceae bacterium]